MMQIIGDDANIDILRRHKEQLAAHLIAMPPSIDDSGIGIAKIAVDRAIERVDSDGELGRHNSSLRGDAQFLLLPVAESPADFEMRLKRGTAGKDVDEARGRVHSKKRALGPSQELDPVDTLQVEDCSDRPGQRYPVERYADRRRQTDVGAGGRDSAHRDQLPKGFADRVDDADRGRQRRELLDGFDVRSRKTVRIEDRNACRNVQSGHRSLRRRDDDLFGFLFLLKDLRRFGGGGTNLMCCKKTQNKSGARNGPLATVQLLPPNATLGSGYKTPIVHVAICFKLSTTSARRDYMLPLRRGAVRG